MICITNKIETSHYFGVFKNWIFILQIEYLGVGNLIVANNYILFI